MSDYEIKAAGITKGCIAGLHNSLVAMRQDSVKMTAFVLVGVNPQNQVVTASSIPVNMTDEALEQLLDLVIESLNSYKGRN